MAWVSQDLIPRRVILKERDRPGAVNIRLIDHVVGYGLDHSYHVVLDGVFYADWYEPMLAGLGRDHLSLSRFTTSTSAWRRLCAATPRVLRG